MRTLTSAILATTLIASSAFGATSSVAPLPSGKPAGVKNAASLGPNLHLILMGAGIAIGGIALVISNSCDNCVSTKTTTTTSTAGLP